MWQHGNPGGGDDVEATQAVGPEIGGGDDQTPVLSEDDLRRRIDELSASDPGLGKKPDGGPFTEEFLGHANEELERQFEAMTEGFVDKPLIEGKTKMILPISGHPDSVNVLSKDDIRAGDGAKHDLIPGKGVWSTTTTCNVFKLLKQCGIPVAFEERTGDRQFTAPKCEMIPLEVVVRREAHGSYLQRNPGVLKRTVFPKLVVEFYLKTKDKNWRGTPIPVDDPYIGPMDGSLLCLYDPHKPICGQDPFLKIKLDEIPLSGKFRFDDISYIAKKVFLILEKAWQLLDRTLVDFKPEFGLTIGGEDDGIDNDRLLLADVVDSDSWRLLDNGSYVDKQVYREGGRLAKVAKNFRQTAELSEGFRIPHQKIIIWRGSDSDNVDPLNLEVRKCLKFSDDVLGWLTPEVVTLSWHKEPVAAYIELQKQVQAAPDSVIIAVVGRSNGAGPSLSANCTVPVITLPYQWERLPEDVWSSLRAPSKTPVMTVLDPKNAALAALQILAMRNPQIYATLRLDQETRLMNICTL